MPADPRIGMCSQPLTANRYYRSRAVAARERGVRGGGRTRTPCGARTCIERVDLFAP